MRLKHAPETDEDVQNRPQQIRLTVIIGNTITLHILFMLMSALRKAVMKYWVIASMASLLFAATAVAGEKHSHSHSHDHKHDHEEEHRQLGAHEHGSGTFNIAIDGNMVSMELEAPGADIVGFEHKATTDVQKALVASAKAKLKEVANVVGLPNSAGCKLEGSTVKLEVEGKGNKASHSEFYAEYQMTCTAPAKLGVIMFPYFENFKDAQELEVSVIGPKSQKRFEVERDAAKIDISGVI